MRHSFFILLFFSLISSSPLSAKTHSQLKPRLVVLTDIGDCNVEPDDMESAIRLLCYADQIEIEAIMTTVGWNCDPYPDGWEKYLYKVVDAYSKDVYNLRKRSNQSSFYSIDKENTQQEIGYWPSPEYIRLRCMPGSHKAGIAVIGENNNTKGSDFLIKLADEDDPRPIYVAAWGSGNTLAQAIWKVKQTRTKEQLKAFLHKFRIYTITDQDMVYNMRMNRAYSSHQWLRSEFKDDLQFIWDEGTWQLQCELGKQNWQIHKHNIPVNINAVVYFHVKSPEDAVIEISDYVFAVIQLTQSALKDIIGTNDLDTILSERKRLGEEIKTIVDEATDRWGIDIDSINVQEIELPEDMKRAMAKQAEAERNRRAMVVQMKVATPRF